MWASTTTKPEEMAEHVKVLRDDLRKILAEETVECVLLCEFGNMCEFGTINTVLPKTLSASAGSHRTGRKTTATHIFFETLLNDLDLNHYDVIADAPYVALINTVTWVVVNASTCDNMCSNPLQRAQHLLLEHVDSKRLVRVMNCHTPTSISITQARRNQTVLAMLEKCSDVSQPTAAWVIGGDFNVGQGALLHLAADHVKRDTDSLSKSGHPITRNPQKTTWPCRGASFLSTGSQRWGGIRNQLFQISTTA
jgi:hypothetical protein